VIPTQQQQQQQQQDTLLKETKVSTDTAVAKAENIKQDDPKVISHKSNTGNKEVANQVSDNSQNNDNSVNMLSTTTKQQPLEPNVDKTRDNNETSNMNEKSNAQRFTNQEEPKTGPIIMDTNKESSRDLTTSPPHVSFIPTAAPDNDDMSQLTTNAGYDEFGGFNDNNDHNEEKKEGNDFHHSALPHMDDDDTAIPHDINSIKHGFIHHSQMNSGTTIMSTALSHFEDEQSRYGYGGKTSRKERKFTVIY
jgi:hypothetical protein